MTDKQELRRLAQEECISSELGRFDNPKICQVILSVLDELRSRELQVDTLTEWYSNSLDQLGAVSAAIPGVLYMDPPDGGSVTLGEQVARMAAELEACKADVVQAPWPDYAGREIRHGDRLAHPSGETFVAVRMNGYKHESDAWRAIYDDYSHVVSRLCLQIGDKGAAVVVGRDNRHVDGKDD